MTDFIGSAGPVLAVSAAIFGPLAGWLAGRRDRQPIVWLVFGALIGPFAVALLLAAPPGRCPLCDSPVHGWAGRCVVCGGRFTRSGDVVVVDQVAARGAAMPGINDRSAEGPAVSGGPIPLPVGRSARARRTVTPDPPSHRFGRTSGARSHDDQPGLDVGEVLATAVYFGGTARLVVGSRYVIVRHLDSLRLLGPVDLDPSAVALERPLADLTATAIGERLVITEGQEGHLGLALAMGAFAGASGAQLEVALSPPVERTSDQPVSR